jgi:hypothetical protein
MNECMKLAPPAISTLIWVRNPCISDYNFQFSGTYTCAVGGLQITCAVELAFITKQRRHYTIQRRHQH